MTEKVFEFNELETSDLIIDAIYKGGSSGNFADEPICKILGCGNQGGFRYLGSFEQPNFVVLYSSLQDSDWPDSLDFQTGSFVYYGDNKNPGHELHDTPKKGNIILKNYFDITHNQDITIRKTIPPFFIFTKRNESRDVIFRGLAVPGSKQLRPSEDLIAIWKTKSGNRFQNYRAYFTILNISTISREWITELQNGTNFGPNCPPIWKNWIENRTYEALESEPTLTHRNKTEQLPVDQLGNRIIKLIYEYFQEDPFGFEYCAAEISRLMDPNIVSIDVTRPWRDGGRDAIGLYRIGTSNDNIEVEFALEAKCFSPTNGVGVRYMSRLISRLKHRQFGIFVTTSYVAQQAYKEIREDNHPVIVISAKDILKILNDCSINTIEKVSDWLHSKFPK